MVSGRRQTCCRDTPRTVIHIPANVKHWHGAAKYRVENIWLEPVSDAYYQSIGKGSTDIDSLIETVPKIANFPFYPRKLDEKEYL